MNNQPQNEITLKDGIRRRRKNSEQLDEIYNESNITTNEKI